MTSDHDPRELRAIALKSAQEIRERRRDIHNAMLPHAPEAEQWEAATDRTSIMARYILATVRDDDGEEQEDVRIDVSQMTCVAVDREGVWVGDHYGLSHLIRDGRPTRGQFRALCRGLGIVPDAAKTV